MRSIGLITLLVAGCGGGGESVQDAYDGPCWPLPSTPGGEVEIGTGDIVFEPIGAEMPITRGISQSDPYLEIHARMRGMPPGDRDDAFDAANPHTKVSAVVIDTGFVVGAAIVCPASLGYVPGPDSGTFDLQHSLRLGFGTTPLSEVSGKDVRVTVEIVGSNGLYAKAEAVVPLETIPATAR
ncbi:MAG: hypothetical protein ABI867_05205 [Kofleriaceae bacterium]